MEKLSLWRACFPYKVSLLDSYLASLFSLFYESDLYETEDFVSELLRRFRTFPNSSLFIPSGRCFKADFVPEYVQLTLF